MNKVTITALCAALLLWLAAAAKASDMEDMEYAWQQLRQGSAIAIMRHALAPGTGDPAEFNLQDCSTQRNLSAEGRDQSHRIGNLFKDKGIEAAQVFSSEWCRCKETAELLDLGAVKTLPELNSFFQKRELSLPQTTQLKSRLPEWLQAGSTPTVLVTHQVNISALTNTFTSSGEILIIEMKADEVIVLASIPTMK